MTGRRARRAAGSALTAFSRRLRRRRGSRHRHRKPPPPRPPPSPPAAEARRMASLAGPSRRPPPPGPRPPTHDDLVAGLQAADHLRGRVADDPGLDALRRLRAVGGLDGDRRAVQRLRRDGDPGDLRGDDVRRGAHPGLEPLARLVERQRDRVADRAGAGARARGRREHADVRDARGELLAGRRVDRDGGGLADLDRADVGLAQRDLHLVAADLRERDEARAAR